MSSGEVIRGDGAGIVLNQLAREQMKLRILGDIGVDLMVCELEGLDARVYVRDLMAMLTDIEASLVRMVGDAA